MSKLGQAYTVLGFFKREKVDYIFDGKQYVDFPCFHCGNKLTMDAISTKWSCEECKEKGNIITLQQTLRNTERKMDKHKIFNPKREYEEIVSNIMKLNKKYNDGNIIKLIEKINDLIEYHKNGAV